MMVRTNLRALIAAALVFVTVAIHTGGAFGQMSKVSPQMENDLTKVGTCYYYDTIKGLITYECGSASEPSAPPASNGDCTRAEAHWKSAEDIKSIAVYEDHLARFPKCEFASLARARIAELEKKENANLLMELMQPGPLVEQAVGIATAPVTVIEYMSLTCPDCARFHNKTYPEYKRRYIDTGKVRHIVRDYPLGNAAAAATMLARCASQDRYFTLIETFFRKLDEWSEAKSDKPLFTIASEAGFTRQTFDACLRDQKLIDDMSLVVKRANEKFGVNSVPTFFINGKRLRGFSRDELFAIIDSLLKN